MIKKAFYPLVLLLLSIAVLSGVSYSWFVYKSGTVRGEAAAAKIKTELIFSLNNNKGIPGETIVISTGSENENIIRKGMGSADYIFKLTYTVNASINELQEFFITGLMLANADELGFIIAEEYNENNRTVAYFGKHIGSGDIQLGNLLATFSEKQKNSDMGKGFDITAVIDACQATEAAAADIFGIDASGKYASLFQ